jgi:heterotetrameric sarcosine oxidase gamma subunit
MAEPLAPVMFRQSLALDWAQVAGAGWRCEPVPGRAAILLKEGPLTALLPERLAGLLGFVLPEPGRTAGPDDRLALWQGPHEWLLLVPGAEAASLIARLRDAAAGVTATVTDLSDRLGQLHIVGPGAAGLLAQGSGLVFAGLATGSVVRTRFLQLAVTFRPTASGIELVTERLHLPYLFDWFSTLHLTIPEQA